MIQLKDYFIKLPSGENLFGPINLEVLAGEVLIIRGRNGGGKSTLIQHLAFHYTENQAHNNTKNQIAYLPQKYGLDFDFPFTLADALLQTNNKKASIAETSFKLSETVNLKRQWATASGGERKKVLILRCLQMQANFLLLDEPLNHLDQRSREIFFSDLNTYLNLNTNACIVIITHDEISNFFKNRTLKYLDLN